MKFKVNDIIKVKPEFYHFFSHFYSDVRIINQSYVVISNKTNMFTVKGLQDNIERIERYGYEELFDLDFRVMRLMKLKKIKNMDKKLENVYKMAVDTWGVESQMNMMTEEIGELLQAISKFRRSCNKSEQEKICAYNHLCEEIADVENMIHQFRYMFDEKLIDKYKEQKLERTLEKLNNSENEGVGK
jgi:NTP pyrophosphatase (non-canonical NTP hydrolase)